jgi:hypothetical protein
MMRCFEQEKGLMRKLLHFLWKLKQDSIRSIITLTIHNSWQIHHLDFKTTFFNKELKKELYVNQHEGFVN